MVNSCFKSYSRQDTDIALAPLTVTPEREQVVDFTIPFDQFQAVVVYWKRPSRESSDATNIKSIEDLVRLGEDNTYRLKCIISYK